MPILILTPIRITYIRTYTHTQSLSAEHAAAWEGASQESLRALRWLGALDSAQPLHSAASVRDSLCALMQEEHAHE